MSLQKASRPTAACAAREPRAIDSLAGINCEATTENPIIQGKLVGSNQCSAEGFTAKGTSPVFALCRLLVDAGFDPALPLHAYRSDTLALRVASIGEGACLAIEESNGIRLSKWKPFSRSAVLAAARLNRPVATQVAGRSA